MARRETDREDLLGEATALVERAELELIASQSAHITAGFRPDGAASIFFGADPVYHFDAANELRRAYCDGLLIKASGRRLVSLRRVRQPNEVQLLRHELTEAQQSAFLIHMRRLLSDLATELNHGAYKVVGQVPEDADVVGRLKEWLAQQDGTRVAATPHASRGGK